MTEPKKHVGALRGRDGGPPRKSYVPPKIGLAQLEEAYNLAMAEIDEAEAVTRGTITHDAAQERAAVVKHLRDAARADSELAFVYTSLSDAIERGKHRP